MLNTALKEAVFRVLPRVKTPAQYSGGELNAVPKDHRGVRGKLCLCFPDTYGLETSTPLSAFDLLGFSLQYEVSYTSVLTMLDLGGVPRRSEDRRVMDP